MEFSLANSNLNKRRWKSRFVLTLIYAATFTAVLPLAVVFFHILISGLPALNWEFFTSLPAPTGQTGGGMGNAILGSLMLVGVASLMAIPIGILGGAFLSEFGHGKIADLFRWSIDLLTSMPSIVVGLFAYAVFVAPFKSFSGLAGAGALAILMLPIIVKTTEEVLRLLPGHIREAGLALGLSRWRVVMFIVVRGRLPAIATGVVLAVARVAGETAPLLITAFGNRNWPTSLLQPTPSMPVQIYNYAISPFQHWHQQAWAGSLTLVLLVFSLNVIVRTVLKQERRIA
jgi:phosphate transport system permease protein